MTVFVYRGYWLHWRVVSRHGRGCRFDHYRVALSYPCGRGHHCCFHVRPRDIRSMHSGYARVHGERGAPCTCPAPSDRGGGDASNDCGASSHRSNN